MSSDYYGGDRYQQLSGELMMDPRDYIASLEEMRDNDAAAYRGLQEYAQKRDALILSLAQERDAAVARAARCDAAMQAFEQRADELWRALDTLNRLAGEHVDTHGTICARAPRQTPRRGSCAVVLGRTILLAMRI